MQRAVEADPSVAFNLFTEVNANLKRHGRPPVTDVSRAVLFMGVNQLISRNRQWITLESTVERAQVDELVRILCRGHHASIQARTIGSLGNGLNGDEMLATSLTEGALEYANALTQRAGYGLNAKALSGLLPVPTDGPDNNAVSRRGIDLAARFARATESSWDDAALEPLYLEAGEITGQDPEIIAKRLRQTTVEAARLSSVFNIYRPVINLLSHVSTTQAPPPTERKTANSAKAARPTPPARIDAPRATEQRSASDQKVRAQPRTRDLIPNKERQKTNASSPAGERGSVQQALSPATAPGTDTTTVAVDQLDDAIAALERSGIKGESPAGLLPRFLQAVCDHCGVSLAALLVRDKSNGMLTLRLHRGLKLPSKLAEVRTHPEKNPLITRLLTAPGAFHWQADLHKHDLAGLPLKLLGEQDGFLFSLHVAGRPLGVVLACRPKTGSRLSVEQFRSFEKLSGVATQSLSQSHARKSSGKQKARAPH